jgi:AcrR family transcriptional regulator
MARAASAKRRAGLLERVVDYMLVHGLADLSLRPLAAALRTSPRMLLYFFGSKEQLLADALSECRARLQREFTVALSATYSRREQLRLAWTVWSSEESRKTLWLFFEAYALAMRNRKRFPGFLEGLVKDWLPFFEKAVAAGGVEPDRVKPVATLILATTRGLQLDVLATGDQARVDGAFRELLDLLSQRANPVTWRGEQQPGAKNRRRGSYAMLPQKSVRKRRLHTPLSAD